MKVVISIEVLNDKIIESAKHDIRAIYDNINNYITHMQTENNIIVKVLNREELIYVNEQNSIARQNLSNSAHI
jgi:hypothetical protein